MLSLIKTFSAPVHLNIVAGGASCTPQDTQLLIRGYSLSRAHPKMFRLHASTFDASHLYSARPHKIASVLSQLVCMSISITKVRLANNFSWRRRRANEMCVDSICEFFILMLQIFVHFHSHVFYEFKFHLTPDLSSLCWWNMKRVK